QGKQINESHSKAVNASITPLDTPLTNESNDSLLSVPKTKVLQTQETQVEYLKPNDKEQLSSESIVVEEVERFNDPIMNSSSVP
ncbi:hypothetical protein ACI4B7_28045, partial [Klebsiella pneumoniae]|uniref:hypothetical protein n=1 Tax=Klebsiella pneumoniae TaxID=573 RepID=UPI0038518D03